MWLQLPSATLIFSAEAKTGAAHTIKKSATQPGAVSAVRPLRHSTCARKLSTPEAFSAGVMSVRPQKIENPSTHHPNLSKYYMKSLQNFDSIGVA